MNWTKQLLAQPQFEVLTVHWDGKIQHSVAVWKVNWFRVCTSEVKCFSSQDQDGLKLDISAGKCKFWILKTSFISGTIKNNLALFSPPLNCYKFVSTMGGHKGLRVFALLQGYPEASWFLPMSWYHDAASKCEGLRLPGTQQKDL